MTAIDQQLKDQLPATLTLSIGLDTVIGERYEWTGTGEPSHHVPETIGDRIAQILAQNVKMELGYEYLRSIRDIANATAERLVEERFREVLAREIIPTDQYGTPKGEGQTIAEALDAKITKHLAEPTGDYNGRRHKLQKMVDDAIGLHLKREVIKTVENAKSAALREVAARVTEGLAESLAKATR